MALSLTGGIGLQRLYIPTADAMNTVPTANFILPPGQMGFGGRDEYGPYLGSLDLNGIVAKDRHANRLPLAEELG
jgi:hypothetical protein